MERRSAVSHEILNAALAGLEAQKETIDAHIASVRAMLGGAAKRRGRPPKQAQAAEPEAATAPLKRKRRGMSAAARKQIAEAMKKRWAAARKAGKTSLS